MLKLFIDTDIGSEMTDAAALTLAATAPNASLLGVTTVTGNTYFRASAAAELLTLLEKPGVPIRPGIGNQASKPTWETEIFTPGEHTQPSFDENMAAELIVGTISQHPHEVTLIGIGPLSNIAKALELCPTLPELTHQLVVMGGMITPPTVDSVKVPRGFEYNFQADAAAAEAVFKAGFDLTIVPGDLTFQKESVWTDEETEEIGAFSHPAVQILAKLSARSFKEVQEDLPKAGFPAGLARRWINDEILMMYVLRPDLFEIEECQLEWSLPDKYPRLNKGATGRNVTLVQRVKNFSLLRGSIIKKFREI